MTLLSTRTLQPPMCKPCLFVYVNQDPKGQPDVCCEQPYAVKQRLCLSCGARAAYLQVLCSWGPPLCHANPPVCPGEHTAAAWEAALACLQCEQAKVVFPGCLWGWWSQTLLISSEELDLSRKALCRWKGKQKDHDSVKVMWNRTGFPGSLGRALFIWCVVS